MRHLMLLPDVVLGAFSEEEVARFLERCVEHQLIVENGRTWLEEVHDPAREEQTGVPQRGHGVVSEARVN
jgi:hypothetical protein